MPLPEMSYARLGATAPEPDHERKDPMDYDDWRLSPPPETPSDDDLERAEDEYEQWLERRAELREDQK